jgi:uncharacterized protein (TIGR02996 family)
MKDEDTLFRDLLASLNEEERQRVNAHLAYFGARARAAADPWHRFGASFGCLRFDSPETFDRLQRAFAAWLQERHDPRGEFLHLHYQLADLAGHLPAAGVDTDLEEVFLRDVLAHPADEVPLLVFADWLEDHDDLRGPMLRLLARVRSLGRSLAAEWVEHFHSPWPLLPPPVYDRYSDPARRVMQLANQQAQRFNHDYIGTQHLLLALLAENFAVAPVVLVALGVSRTAAAQEVERIAPTGPEMVTMGKLPQSARTRATVRFSLAEADALGHQTVAPAHVLLGLCRANPCVATRVLDALGASPAAVCTRLLVHLDRAPRRWLRDRPEVW